MSSSNFVSLIAIEEAEYGVTPDLSTVTANTVRYTSESMSGSPELTESTEVRTDRQSNGQIIVGSTIGGDVNQELARNVVTSSLFKSGMMDLWSGNVETAMDIAVTQNADPEGRRYTLTTTTGDFTTLSLSRGDIVLAKGFDDANEAFETVYQVTGVAPTTTTLNVWGPYNLGDSTSDGTTLVQPPSLSIGSTVNSLTLSKAYQDVVHTETTPDYHGQTYPGSVVSSFTIGSSYGEIMTAAWTILANGYTQDVPSLYQQVETAGGTINAAGDLAVISSATDSGLLTVDDKGVGFCVESWEVTLDNNLTPQNCIGQVTASKFNIGKANVSFTMSVYNSDVAYDRLMALKWNQNPMALTLVGNNEDGGYVFEMPSVQLNFPDPASTGENTQVMMEVSGVAKIGDDGESALTVYRTVE